MKRNIAAALPLVFVLLQGTISVHATGPLDFTANNTDPGLVEDLPENDDNNGGGGGGSASPDSLQKFKKNTGDDRYKGDEDDPGVIWNEKRMWDLFYADRKAAQSKK